MKPFERYHLYHGANGDKILSIIASGEIRPNHKGEVFFSQFEWADCLMHGYDEKRKASFVIGVNIEVPSSAIVKRIQTPGVRVTLVVVTQKPLKAQVIELYIREPGALRGKFSFPAVIVGAHNITHYLQSRQGPSGAAAHD